MTACANEFRATPKLCLSSQERIMRCFAIVTGGACALLSLIAAASAAEVPSYFREIVGTQSTSTADVATKNVLQLNTTMFELYGDAGQIFKRNILAQHPLILGLFSGA